jgi:hypothetical protein
MTDEELECHMPGDELYLSTWTIGSQPRVRKVRLENNPSSARPDEYRYEVTGGSLHRARDLHLTSLGARQEIAGRIRDRINTLEALLCQWDRDTELCRRETL